MNLQLDPHVRAAFDAIVAHTPELGAAPDHTTHDRPEPSPKRTWMAAAAVALIVSGVLGLAVLRPHRATAPAPASNPATMDPPTTEAPVVATPNPGDPGDGQAVLPDRLPTDWATTHESLPQWPSVRISEPAATVLAFGLYVCDSGGATFHTSLMADAEPHYSYYGTLCPSIRLDRPAENVVAVCGTVSGGIHFARCQLEPALAGEAEGTTVPDAEAAQVAPPIDDLPSPTDAAVPAAFTANVSGARNDAVSDGRVTMILREPRGDEAVVWSSDAVCYLIALPGAMADGCHWPGAVANGLTYGVFRDHAGALDVVGVVPDEIVSVTVTGATEAWSTEPVNNLWHVTVRAGEAFEITVTAEDGRQASTAIS